MSSTEKEFAQSVKDPSSLSLVLNDICSELYFVNDEIKKIENKKSELRSKFFDLATEYIKLSQTLAYQYIDIHINDDTSAKQYVQENYPEWRFVKRDDNGILIEEDPTKIKFVWTNEEGFQCSRNSAVVGARFDTEKFVKENPDISQLVMVERTVYEFDEKKAEEMIDSDPSLLPIFQKYALPGKIQMKLGSPKKVEKENE